MLSLEKSFEKTKKGIKEWLVYYRSDEYKQNGSVGLVSNEEEMIKLLKAIDVTLVKAKGLESAIKEFEKIIKS